MERYELNKYLAAFKSRLNDLAKALDIDNLKIAYKEQTDQMTASDFWDDVKKSSKYHPKNKRSKGTN